MLVPTPTPIARRYLKLPLDPSQLNPGLANLIAWWKFNGTLADSSGNGHTLQAPAAPSYLRYAQGFDDRQCLVFPALGANDRLELVTPSTALGPEGDYHFACWFRPMQDGTWCVSNYDSATAGADADNAPWFCFRAASSFTLSPRGFYGGWEYLSPGAYTWYGDGAVGESEKWNFLVWGRTGQNQHGWINGRRIWASWPTLPLAPNRGANSKFVIGATGAGASLANMAMQDFCFFNVAPVEALVQAEAKRIGAM